MFMSFDPWGQNRHHQLEDPTFFLTRTKIVYASFIFICIISINYNFSSQFDKGRLDEYNCLASKESFKKTATS